MDDTDRKILSILQADATVALADLAEQVNLSTTPCWRRIKALEEKGVITRRVALLDPEKMNVGLTVFIAIRTNQHSLDWLTRFQRAIDGIPEIARWKRVSQSSECWLVRIAMKTVSPTFIFSGSSNATRLVITPFSSSALIRRQQGVVERFTCSAKSA